MERREIGISYCIIDSLDDLEVAEQHLMKMAFEALEGSYSPYSNFKVGAAVLLESGEIVKGSNQENAAYPSGMCAERVALFATGANFPGEIIKALAIVTPHENLELPIGPCGGCRQVMLEYELKQASPIKVLMGGSKGKIYTFSDCKGLMPFFFGPTDLKKEL
ncbi:MAG: cytidine deaminase [Flavobacteriales bacterium]|nr:cytidine deaminase [Flavobacteriales bacterium]